MEWIIGVCCGIIAAVIVMLLFPNDIRSKIIKSLRQRIIRFVIDVDLSKEDIFPVKLVTTKKFRQYLSTPISNIVFKVKDKRYLGRHKGIKKEVKNKVINKCKEQIQVFKKAAYLLLIDNNSIYHDRILRDRSLTERLFIAMLKLSIAEKPSIYCHSRFVYYATKSNKLNDLSVNLNISIELFKKIQNKKETILLSSFRSSIDVYDMDLDDFIETIAPAFYVESAKMLIYKPETYKNSESLFKLDDFEIDLREFASENKEYAD